MALRTFDLIYVSTPGGPGTSTTVPSVLVYQNAFANGRVGLAAAMAVVLTLLIFVVAFGITRLVDRDPTTMTVARREQLLSYFVLGVFAIVALYPILSIVLLAFHRRIGPRHAASRSRTTSSFDTFKAAWDEGSFGRGLLNSFIVAATVTVVTAVLSTLAGYAFGTMRFRGSRHAVLPAADRADLPLRGDGHPALLRVQGRRADRQPTGR